MSIHSNNQAPQDHLSNDAELREALQDELKAEFRSKPIGLLRGVSIPVFNNYGSSNHNPSLGNLDPRMTSVQPTGKIRNTVVEMGRGRYGNETWIQIDLGNPRQPDYKWIPSKFIDQRGLKNLNISTPQVTAPAQAAARVSTTPQTKKQEKKAKRRLAKLEAEQLALASKTAKEKAALDAKAAEDEKAIAETKKQAEITAKNAKKVAEALKAKNELEAKLKKQLEDKLANKNKLNAAKKGKDSLNKAKTKTTSAAKPNPEPKKPTVTETKEAVTTHPLHASWKTKLSAIKDANKTNLWDLAEKMEKDGTLSSRLKTTDGNTHDLINDGGKYFYQINNAKRIFSLSEAQKDYTKGDKTDQGYFIAERDEKEFFIPLTNGIEVKDQKQIIFTSAEKDQILYKFEEKTDEIFEQLLQYTEQNEKDTWITPDNSLLYLWDGTEWNTNVFREELTGGSLKGIFDEFETLQVNEKNLTKADLTNLKLTDIKLGDKTKYISTSEALDLIIKQLDETHNKTFTYKLPAEAKKTEIFLNPTEEMSISDIIQAIADLSQLKVDLNTYDPITGEILFTALVAEPELDWNDLTNFKVTETSA